MFFLFNVKFFSGVFVLNQNITFGEGCGHIKPVLSPEKFITDCYKAVLLMWFILIVFVCTLPASL